MHNLGSKVKKIFLGMPAGDTGRGEKNTRRRTAGLSGSAAKIHLRVFDIE
jgi:hypothetical protein